MLDTAGVADERFAITAGAGDDRINQSAPSNVPRTGPWSVDLGPGDDRYEGSDGLDGVSGGAGSDRVDARGGSDQIEMGGGEDTITPGPGGDSVVMGSGDDTVLAGPEAERLEADSYDGGTGFDTISYLQRQTPIFVAKIAFSGGSGDEDAIQSFEAVVGGSGSDTVLGLGSQGMSGDDLLTGGNGGDTIVGGPGSDTLRGFGGSDILDARDGIADAVIDCGTGLADVARLDLLDPKVLPAIGLATNSGCELIDRRAIDEEPATVMCTPPPGPSCAAAASHSPSAARGRRDGPARAR